MTGVHPAASPTGGVARLLLLFLVLSLVLAACGRGTDSEPAAQDGEDTAEQPTAATAPEGTEEDTEPAGDEEPAGDSVRLTYASFAAADSPHSEAFDHLADELESRTNGRVTIERFHSGALCAFDQMIDCLRDGRADFAIFLPVQSPTDFPLSTVSSVLFVSRDTWAHSQAFNELAENDEGVRVEWEAQGIVPLYFMSIGPAVLGTDEPVPGVEWLDGKSVRSTGFFTDALDVAGANPVAIPNADVYESMQRGVIDAFYASTLDGAAIDNNHYEVTTHWYDLGAGEYTTLATGMSQAAMDQLTPEEQDILAELVEDVQGSFFDEYYLPAMETACTNALEGGVEVFEMWPEEEMQAFAELAEEPIRDRWIEETSATGAPAEEFFETFVETVREKEAESPLEATATELCAARAGG